MEPLVAGQLGDVCVVDVGVIVGLLLDCMAVAAALLLAVIVTGALLD